MLLLWTGWALAVLLSFGVLEIYGAVTGEGTLSDVAWLIQDEYPWVTVAITVLMLALLIHITGARLLRLVGL